MDSDATGGHDLDGIAHEAASSLGTTRLWNAGGVSHHLARRSASAIAG